VETIFLSASGTSTSAVPSGGMVRRDATIHIVPEETWPVWESLSADETKKYRRGKGPIGARRSALQKVSDANAEASENKH
jgi:hypothetical protein